VPAPDIRSFLLEGSNLVATTSWRTDLAGKVDVRIGDKVVPGNISGVVATERRTQAESGERADSSGSSGSSKDAPASSSGSSTTSTTAAPPAPRSFTADLTLRLDDGRVVRLSLTGTLTDSDAGYDVAGQLRAVDELCATDLGTAKLGGTLQLRDAPLTSSARLQVDGVALDRAAMTKAACGSSAAGSGSSAGTSNSAGGETATAAEADGRSGSGESGAGTETGDGDTADDAAA
jgi:hypothetical protein